MSLFQRETDKSRVKFHCLELSDNELRSITKLVEENGGEVGVDTACPVKFMPRMKYSSDIDPLYRVYDVEFITSCVKYSKIIDPQPFRLGPKRLWETCMMNNFLYGPCYYKRKLSKLRVDLDSSLSSVYTDAEVDMPLAAPVIRSQDMDVQNDNGWNEPGTSGVNLQKQSVHHDITVSGSSSDDEDVRNPVLAKKSKNASRHELETSSDEEEVTKPIDRSPRKHKEYYASSKDHKRQHALRYARSWRSRMLHDGPKTYVPSYERFTPREQRVMVDYLTSYDDIQSVQPKGLKIWHEMRKREHLTHRTPQSLQNHFVKHLLPHIGDFSSVMSDEHAKQFEALQTSNRKRTGEKKKPRKITGRRTL